MKTQIGTAITGDFEDNTMTFEIEGDMTLCAGKYAIVPIEAYNRLVNNFALDNVSYSDPNCMIQDIKTGKVLKPYGTTIQKT